MREEMLTKVIRMFGFENPITINFARMMEDDTFSNDDLAVIVRALEEYPPVSEDEDDYE